MLNSVSAGFLTRDGNSVRYSQNENVEYEYNAGLLTKIDRTGAVYEFEYDGYSRIKKVTLNGVTVYTAAYNKTADGKSYTNVSYGNGWTGEEVSDEYGRFIEKSVTKDGVKQTLASAEYDKDTMQLKSLTDSACGSGKTTKMTYVYDEHGETTSVRYTGYRIGEYSQETDSEGYVTKTTYEKNIGETQTYKYLYEKYGTTSGNRVPNAPLTWLYLPTDKKIKYVYDALNRLKEKGIVTEKDEYYSELYTYEEGGYQEYTIYNRFLKNNISPFCIGGGCSGGSTGGGGETKPPVTTILPDRVTTFISQVEFRGLNLTDKYEYDKNGNISRRTIGGSDIRYTYDDIDRLIREDNAALNKTYFYEYDDFGNIEKVAEYKYDAWGNHRIYNSVGIDITEDMSYNSNVAKLNPFRYRGYYYDTETGLYYLNSRYYDPSVGRFINADDISYIRPTDINGLNLFAYCYNNPVMYYDFGGAFPILIALILGAFTVAGMVTGGVTAHNQGKTGWAVVGDIFLGGAMGFAAGGLVIATIGAGAAIFGSAGLSTYILGVTAARAFALGALAYNAIAMFVAPIIGISMQPIEWGNPSYKPEKPGETPKHPAYRKTKSNFTKVGMIDLSCIYMIY